MIEITGDFWEEAHNYDLLCVTTNGMTRRVGDHYNLVMGAGIAKQFANRYPTLPRVLGHWVRTAGNIPKFTRFPNNSSVLSIPTKDNWRDPSTMKLVLQSARIALTFLNNSTATSVLSVRPGCGLGGLRWEDVKPGLEQAGWDDRFTIISPGARK